MITFWLTFTLLSDATFGRGEGVPGLVDAEVEHDAYGIPYLRGRTLKGLLTEECANILWSLQQISDRFAPYSAVAAQLFGSPGSQAADTGLLRIGEARLPSDLGQLVVQQVSQKQLDRIDVLEALTDIRRQTAMDEVTGRPDDGSLRAMRVIIRQTPFEALLQLSQSPSEPDKAFGLLAACVLAFRRAGIGRNRGRGHLRAALLDAEKHDVTQDYFALFQEEVSRESHHL